MSVNVELIDPETGEPESWERGHVCSHLVEAAKVMEREKDSINVPSPSEIDRAKQILGWLTWLPHRADKFIVMRGLFWWDTRSRNVAESYGARVQLSLCAAGNALIRKAVNRARIVGRAFDSFRFCP